MDKIFNFLKDKKNIALLVVILAVSGVVGGVFGYYAAVNLIPRVANLPPAVNNNGQSGSSLFGLAPKNTATSDEQAVINAVKKVSPGVVSIVATKDLTIVDSGQYNPLQDFCSDPFFKQFFGDQCDNVAPPQQPKTRTQKQQVAAGTGFIISSDGLVLTNKHVIDIVGADFTVITNNNKKYPATILAKDPVQDLAVLKIQAAGLLALTLGDSNQIEVGQTVIAIGNALGQFSNTVSKGVISGLARSIIASEGGSGSSEKLDQVIQTDAAINPGNSGGPLVNLSGQVVGINTAVVQGAQNIGFAIPINQAKRDVSQVIATGAITYPYLGIRYVPVDDAVKAQNNLSVDYGALVTRGANHSEVAVAPDSPADKAGIKEGDVILELNGAKINQNNDLAKLLQSYSVGSVITLRVLSGGQQKTVSITLAKRTP